MHDHRKQNVWFVEVGVSKVISMLLGVQLTKKNFQDTILKVDNGRNHRYWMDWWMVTLEGCRDI